MKFKITEENRSFWDEKPRFIKLYNEGATMKTILKTCNITGPQYNKLVHECDDEGSIVSRRKKLLGEL